MLIGGTRHTRSNAWHKCHEVTPVAGGELIPAHVAGLTWMIHGDIEQTAQIVEEAWARRRSGHLPRVDPRQEPREEPRPMLPTRCAVQPMALLDRPGRRSSRQRRGPDAVHRRVTCSSPCVMRSDIDIVTD